MAWWYVTACAVVSAGNVIALKIVVGRLRKHIAGLHIWRCWKTDGFESIVGYASKSQGFLKT